jgi:flagellar basal body rod protein FlgB
MNLVERVLPIFEAHKNEEEIEIEIRLGKHNGSLFDTNVGKDTWKRVLAGLKKYDGWESVKTTTADVYYNDANNVRITCDEESGEQTMIQKISVIKEDFKRDPLDVRFCVAREIPTSGEYEMDRKRSKTRHSFVRKNLSIDMTISSGDNVDMDSEEEAMYQIEMEIVKPSDVDSIYKFQNILQKIDDLCKLIPQ